MKKNLSLVLFLLFSSFMHAESFRMKGLYCGTRGNFLGTLASDYAIPDYFPPENFLTRLFVMNPFFSNLSVCEEEYETVHLGQSCKSHDECYLTLGSNKDSCDTKLLDNWLRSCAERYKDQTETAEYCLNSCNNFVNFMYNIMRYDDGLFCPSCIAFEKDQEIARQLASRI